MNAHRILVAAVLLAIPALASAATPITPSPAAPATGVTPVVAPATAPSLDAFLATLGDPAATPVNKAASSCGSNFCTQAQRTACSQQCLQHHAGPFVCLECCSDSCTTLCICGSVPVRC